MATLPQLYVAQINPYDQARAMREGYQGAKMMNEAEEIGRQATARKSLSEYMQNQTPGGYNALAQADPAMAMQARAYMNKTQGDEMTLQKARIEQALTTGYQILPNLKPEHYAQFRQGMIEAGVSAQLLPEEFSEEWRTQALENEEAIAGQLGKKVERYTVNEGGNEVTYQIMPLSGRKVKVGSGPKFKPESGSWSQPFEATGPDGKPILLRQNAKTGAIEEVKGFGPKPPRGMRVEVGADGDVMFATNAEQGGSQQLTGPTRNKQQEAFIGLQDQAARLVEIERMFDPKFLTLEGRGKSLLLTAKDFLGSSMTPEQEKFYGDRTQFLTQAYRQINAYIKDITGAALSEKEATRIMQGAPNPEDPPQKYASKLKATMHDVRLALARKAYALQKGINFDDVSIERMPAIIDRRGDQLFQQIKQENPQADEEAIGKMVKDKLQQEFGVI